VHVQSTLRGCTRHLTTHLQDETVAFMAKLGYHLVQHAARLVKRPELLGTHSKGLPLPVIQEAAGHALRHNKL
jgi:hypothetical protein